MRQKSFFNIENPSPPNGMKTSFKDTFPPDEKYISLAGVSEKWKKLTSSSQKISFDEQK